METLTTIDVTIGNHTYFHGDNNGTIAKRNDTINLWDSLFNMTLDATTESIDKNDNRYDGETTHASRGEYTPTPSTLGLYDIHNVTTENEGLLSKASSSWWLEAVLGRNVSSEAGGREAGAASGPAVAGEQTDISIAASYNGTFGAQLWNTSTTTTAITQRWHRDTATSTNYDNSYNHNLTTTSTSFYNDTVYPNLTQIWLNSTDWDNNKSFFPATPASPSPNSSWGQGVSNFTWADSASTAGGHAMEATVPCDGLLCLDFLHEAAYNFTNNTFLSDTGPQPCNWEILLLLLVVLAGITGNVLVCIAVVVEKKLQNVTNYFLMSLAVADLFVSLVVMPCSILHEFLGYWPFDLVMCDFWQVLDVMMCTSSIMHMTTISMDRYIAIRNPLKIRNKSRTIVGVKIIAVWLISLAIASPIILLGVLDPANVLWNDTCAIFNANFLVYGSLAAFFIPLFIMFIAYSLTIHILNKQAKLCAKKSKSGAPVMRRSTSKKRKKAEPPSALGDMQANGLGLARILRSHIDRSRATPSEKEPLHKDKGGETDTEASPSPLIVRIRKAGTGTGTGPGTGTAEDGSPPGDKPVTSPKLQVLVKKHSAAIKAASILLQKRNESIQKKEINNVKTEQKAVKVLGTMFAIFVICWTPFFSLNFAMGVCETCNIDVSLFKVFLWLGYVSSTLNPIIYTIFNKNFKRTFIRILTCKVFPKRKVHKSLTFTTSNGNSIRVKYDNNTNTTCSINQKESML